MILTLNKQKRKFETIEAKKKIKQTKKKQNGRSENAENVDLTL